MEMNDVAFNAMYMRLGFSAPAAMELVRTKGINSLRLIGGLKDDSVKSLVNSIRRPGGDAIGNHVSETSKEKLALTLSQLVICLRKWNVKWSSKGIDIRIKRSSRPLLILK